MKDPGGQAAGAPGRSLRDLTILVKGAGEMATGIAHRLWMANLRRIVMTEIDRPLTVRRMVAFSEAVYDGKCRVEGVTARRIDSLGDLESTWAAGEVAVIVDPRWTSIAALRPDVVIDAIMAKKNLGTARQEAPLVIGVGPGFTAPDQVHAVIESNRGQDLGRVIYEGSAEPHTGVPGDVGGHTSERVVRAPAAGKVRHIAAIGDRVSVGDAILAVGDAVVKAPIAGILRGLIREIDVTHNEKVGDIDPRGQKEHFVTITEKARAIGGGVLEAMLHFQVGAL